MLTLLSVPSVRAAELPLTHLTVMGSLGGTAQYRDIEEPFWKRQLSADSGGRVTADMSPFDRTGLKGFEALQMARLGVISFLTLPLSLVSSEDPEANAADLPGLNPSMAEMRANLTAYRPVLSELYRTRYGLEPLAMMSYPQQVLFCKERFERLSDLAGRRIRVASGIQASMIGALGARGIVLPLGDVDRALANGLVDCAVTGTLTGNALGLPRTTHYIYALALNWGLQIVLANRVVWQSLAPEVRSFLADELAALEQRVWDQAEHADIQGFACDTGRNECTDGVKSDMVLVAEAPDDRELLDRILRTVILPKWAARCGEDCAAQWNRTVGARMGLTAEAALQ
ncbi:MAG TPA: TRAP transporter substrate-binding protein [Aliidongia sp.]|uniref:TRAP transporter substrate-binding protein n=1 Tax=Aliidongia sp. TaxID=1914230 RepID=UPI002DDD91B9|nr:TRAP transporter substrate-binding protein [Aliidongia sp.]HEV2673556.1 TRAP transporter substrate-binding protein [Aliidongia sp.]